MELHLGAERTKRESLVHTIEALPFTLSLHKGYLGFPVAHYGVAGGRNIPLSGKVPRDSVLLVKLYHS